MVSALSSACVEWAAARAVALAIVIRATSSASGCSTRTMIAVLGGLGHGLTRRRSQGEGVRLLEQARTRTSFGSFTSVTKVCAVVEGSS
jgi:hypothetical protein